MVGDAKASRNSTATRHRTPPTGIHAGNTLTDILVPALLKTPTAQLAVNGGSQHPDKRRAGGHGPTLADQVEHQLLPTPTADDSGNTPEDHLRKKPGCTQVTSLQVIADYGLLPTGGRIAEPSPDGSTRPAAQHPAQLSLDGLESD
jgi:hypothetical protein